MDTLFDIERLVCCSGAKQEDQLLVAATAL